MLIKDFKEVVRVGSGWPASLDVFPICGHESQGVAAQAFTYRGPNDTGYIQFRKATAMPAVALLAFRYEDTQLPHGWKDSELLWDSRSVGEQNDNKGGKHVRHRVD